MAKNLALDPINHDLVVENFQLRLTQSNSEFVSQKITQRLKHFEGEWWLDPTKGVPYFGTILIKRPDTGLVRNILFNVVADTIGVEEVVTFEVNYDKSSRTYSVSFEARITEGEIIVNEVVL
jgi:hypothetical protein